MRGFDRVRPPSLELTVQTALGRFPFPLSVTKDMYIVPSGAKVTSGA